MLVVLARVRFQFQIPAPAEAFGKVRQFICVYWQTGWNILVDCQSIPFLYASFRPVNTSIWKCESCLCSESAQIAPPVSPRGNPVVWHSSQLFMCWGSWAKPLCQVIVSEESLKKKEGESLVFFAWHMLQLEAAAEILCSVFTGMSRPACLFTVMSPPPLLFTKQG